MKKKKLNLIKGVSIISLVITIIVILILATIVFIYSLNSIGMAGRGKFSAEIADFKQNVQNEFYDIKGDYSVKKIDRKDKDIYYEMATGIKNTEAIPSGYVEYLGIDIIPSLLQGNEYYEITNKKLLDDLYPNLPKEQIAYITDVGDCFIYPGYLASENDEMRLYINEKNYYIEDALEGITVTFDANEGNVIPNKKNVKVTQKYNILPVPTKEGYEFKGWYTSKDGGELITSESIVNMAENHTLYAQWIKTEYKVEFNVNGGDITFSSKTVKYNEEYGSLPTPIRADYIFKGWYTALNGGELITSSSIVKSTGNHTLYAQWLSNKQTVTFDANGGSVSPESKVVKYNEAYGSLPTPTKSGYTFTGWYTALSGGEEITSGSIVRIESDQTLYAVWTPKEYIITFDANGGTIISDKKIVKYKEMYGDLPVPTRVGYTFEGWFTQKNNGAQITNNSIVNMVENHTLYAGWIAKEYTVTLDGNGGSVTPNSIVVKYNSTYEKLPTPTRTGYDFKGWYTGKSNGTQITNNSIANIADNQTIYAQWIPKEYTVTLDSNGGNVTPNNIVVKYDSPYEKIPTPTRTGYDFNGWYTDKTSGRQITNDSIVNVAEDQTIYAKWIPKEYTVTLDGNGGSVTPNSIVVKYDSTYENLSTPTRTGYDFNGWYTDKTGGTQVTSSTVVKLVKNQTLYARWVPKEYAINFDANGGTGLTTGKTVKYDGVYGDLPKPTRTGYAFDGWYTEKTGGTLIESSTRVAITTDITLYAKWTVNKYTVTFNNMDGTMSTKEVAYNTAYGELPTPMNDIGSFVGWYTEEEYINPVTASTILDVANQVTLYAKWKMENVAIYTAGNTSLTFYKPEKMIKVGDVYGTNAITAIYPDVETTKYSSNSGYAPWNQYASVITKVSFANEVKPQYTKYWFYNFSNCTSIDLTNLNTENTLAMSSMFADCSKLTNLDVSGLVTTKVSDINSMFKNCSNLTVLDVSNFDTSKVEDMYLMFGGCKKLTTIDISNFATTNLKIMTDMFYACVNLTTIKLPKNTTAYKLTSMGRLFYNCFKLKAVDMSGIKTSKSLVNISNMFAYCNSILDIKFSSDFNTSGVTDMGSMFYQCRELKSLDLSMFDTSNVTKFTYESTLEPYELRGMFKDCSKLETIYVSDKFIVQKATDPELGSTDMFFNCTSLKGGNNTVYDSNYIDKTYARIDGKDYDGDGVADKGYFTQK